MKHSVIQGTVIAFAFVLFAAYNAKAQDIYSQAVGKKYLAGGEAVIKRAQQFTFVANEGATYELVVEAAEEIAVSFNGLTITLPEGNSKSFKVTGATTQSITVWITPKKGKTSIAIGWYYVGRDGQ